MLIQSPSAHSSVSIEDAFAYCASITQGHYENFPVASLFLPEEKRPYVQSLYAFARKADDFADEGKLPESERLASLNQWEDQLKQCYDLSPGEITHPVFIALRETVSRLAIPIDPLLQLLLAFKMDVTKHRFSDFDEILHYCRHSANPVGRLVLMIFGYNDEKLFTLSDNICTALQLANFWQDVAIDLQKNRVYIPQSDLLKFAVTEQNLRQRLVDGRFKALLEFEVGRTRELFYRGAELPRLVDKDLRLELKLVWFGGMTILRKIERAGYDVLYRRPSIHALNKFSILFNGLFRNDLSRYKRKPQWDLT